MQICIDRRLTARPVQAIAFPMLLTADLLLNYQRCNRRAFLDVYGDASLRDERSDYIVKLLQDSADNQRSVLASIESNLETQSDREAYRIVERVYLPSELHRGKNEKWAQSDTDRKSVV